MASEVYLLWATGLFVFVLGIPSFLHCLRLLQRVVEAMERMALAEECFTASLLGLLDGLISSCAEGSHGDQSRR